MRLSAKIGVGFVFLGHLLRDPVMLLRCLGYHILTRLGIPRLKAIFLCPSHECNAYCVHCYEKFNHEKFRQSLTTQQVKKILDQFSRLGGYYIYFCSGEFLLRDDALELIRYARSKHLVVNLTTNGLLLDEKTVDDLKEAGVVQLIVSIDSADASRHDQLRGVEGCFQKAVKGITLAKRKGMITWIWTYVTKTNLDQLAGIAKLGEELDVDCVYVFFPLLSGALFNRFDENLTYQERELFRKQFNNSLKVEVEFPTEDSPCIGGGRLHICVMPSGDVTFCPPVPYSYGNIKSKTLKECLNDIRKDHKRFSFCKGQCVVNFPEYRQNCSAKFMYE